MDDNTKVHRAHFRGRAIAWIFVFIVLVITLYLLLRDDRPKREAIPTSEPHGNIIDALPQLMPWLIFWGALWILFSIIRRARKRKRS